MNKTGGIAAKGSDAWEIMSDQHAQFCLDRLRGWRRRDVHIIAMTDTADVICLTVMKTSFLLRARVYWLRNNQQ